MVYSENYNFALPEDGDHYDISPLSENFETLDGILSENESAVEEISDKIGTPAENGQTLFSLLANNNSGTGFTAIKSLQRALSGNLQGKTSKTIKINSVDPTKCLCILERLQDDCTVTEQLEYELNTDSVTFTAPGLNYIFTVGLWIIEFC